MSVEVIPYEAPQSQAVALRPANPMDVAPAEFKGALARRSENRKTLIEWIRSSLVAGTDYGKIHTKKRDSCRHGGPPNCTPEKEPFHWSKDSLRKPGAEKICGMLGVTVVFPNLRDYEQAALSGTEIGSILLRCQILAADGTVLADGVGARTPDQGDDLNKALKMACKSAHIDATLRMAGLSELFTQDIEDMPASAFDREEPAPARHFGAGRGKPRTAAPQARPPEPHRTADDGVATEKQIKLIRVKLDQAGMSAEDLCARFELDSVTELPFARVNEALAYIADPQSDEAEADRGQD